MGLDAWLLSFASQPAPRGQEALILSRALVAALGNPQRCAPAIHIVGTAGKGSVASLLTARFVASGRKVATHQSPHVDDIRERFLLDGELPAPSIVDVARREVMAGVAEVEREHGRAPSFFAITAAMSWVLGRRSQVDLLVTEAGIGGRLDATAVLDRPDTLTVITNIGLDHTDVLGGTVEAIAREKVAVLVGRARAVVGPQSDPVALAVARDVAADNGVELHEVASNQSWKDDAIATADVAARLVASTRKWPLGECEPVFPPGRDERLSLHSCEWILDGAHNPLKLRTLAASLRARPTVVVAAIGERKDLAACAAALVAIGAPVIATEFASVGPHSWSTTALADAVRASGGEAEVSATISAEIDIAHARAQPGETVLVTGSFLMLADARTAMEQLRARPGLPAATREWPRPG